MHDLFFVIVFFSSLSFYHGLDMFLATRDALVINGSYPGFFCFLNWVHQFSWEQSPPHTAISATAVDVASQQISWRGRTPRVHLKGFLKTYLRVHGLMVLCQRYINVKKSTRRAITSCNWGYNPYKLAENKGVTAPHLFHRFLGRRKLLKLFCSAARLENQGRTPKTSYNGYNFP